MKHSAVARLLFVPGVFLILFAVPAAQAGSIWTNASSGFWQDSINWAGGAPTNMAETWITNVNSKTVAIDPATPLENLAPYKIWLWAPATATNTLAATDLTSDHPLHVYGTVTVGRNGSLELTNSTMKIDSSVTISNLGSLRIVNSAVDITAGLNLNVFGGNLILDSGSLTITDTNITARVGRSTNGAITLNEGNLHFAGNLTLGESYNRSHGLLQINGGQAQIDGVLSLSEGTGSTGTIVMMGGELVLTNSTNNILRVGNAGFGQVLMTNATVHATVLTLGANDTGSGLIWLNNSQMFVGGFTNLPDFTNIVRIGDAGHGQVIVSNSTLVLPNTSIARHTNSFGQLTVQDNAIVSFQDDTSIGRFNGATGIVSVLGGQLLCTNAPIWVGRDGVGFLTVSNGLVQTEALLIANVPTNSARGTFTLAGGSVLVSSNFILGDTNISTSVVSIVGGSLCVTNPEQSAFLEITSGSFTMNGGTAIVDNFFLTNSGVQMGFHSGTMKVRNSLVANGAPFTVGDGVQPATLYLMQGTNVFTDGLIISPNATVTGCGTIVGNIINYGTLTNDCGTGTPPTISEDPLSQTVTQGNPVAFTVVATGTEILSYQWRLGGNPIPAANDPLYSIVSAGPFDAGDYDVIVANDYGSVTSQVATLTILSPPEITVQPVGGAVGPGSNFTFSVTAIGSPTLSYQWRLATNAILGANSATYSIVGASPLDAGDYDVIVANDYGSITSQVATLTLLSPPQITRQPVGSTAGQGSSVTLSVTATGSEPLFYQWQFQGEPLAGQTNSTLALTDLQATNAGPYAVRVSNPVGSQLSDSAELRVFVLPRITRILASNSVVQVFFTTENGAVYTLEYIDDLSVTNWLAVPVNVNGSGNVESLSDTNATPAVRVYRIRGD